MGRPKALIGIQGRFAIDVICGTLRAGGADDVIAVLGRHAVEVRAEADLRGVRVVENPRWETGRTSSVQCGIAALPADAEWTLLALVDMPLVRAATVRSLIEATSGDADVIVPWHHAARGHPIVIRRTLFPRILALGPDEPLHGVTRTARCEEVDVPDAGVLIDLDTPEDLRQV